MPTNVAVLPSEQLDMCINRIAICVYQRLDEIGCWFALQGWTVASDSVKGESYVVRGLRPGTSYRFIVRAQNSHGLSLPSPITGVVKTKGEARRYVRLV